MSSKALAGGGVCIVGAGPPGLVMAHLLHVESGHTVCVLEQRSRAEVGGRPKAGLTEYRTVQLLQRECIAGSVVDFTTENHRGGFRTADGSAMLDYGALTSGWPHYIYPQHLLVERLCAALVESGGDVRFEQTVTWLEHTIHAPHLRGFAGYMRRGPAQTRYYLEVQRTDTFADWPEDRVRDERLGIGDRLDGVPFGETTLMDLRVRVIEAMQDPLLARSFAHAYASVDPD